MLCLSPRVTPPPGNHLLNALPPEDLASFRPRLERVDLSFRQTLQMAEEPITSIHFPENGYLSRLAIMDNGDAAEIGLIGAEGMTGIAVLLGDDRDSFEIIVQVPGPALSIGLPAFRTALEQIPSLRRLLLRYALAHFEQVARTGACNGRHPIDQRLARWLLMAHDRAGGDAFPMTHEFLSMMLGVRRAGVTVAAGLLQKAGHIRYERGRIEITNRTGLEACACECYGAARRAQDRLLHSLPPAKLAHCH
ncbi:Crp/Fnr family transcriptional regulator [Teichococcus vastitatis]|uniref:Crp/Fnr family transcriptional regulator n=1 Tax=Teichococcus vastitatis TaxID=2307076 RepID=A0ABS9W743_9PROT|nr:Crp/Fnr family transcriptional regulator [Pseudoroseomonas vastitatis]MCI0755057.1 Crp/Fnr family transcriptional regulator [Pseudoroseomonas vastitatis]